MADDIEQMIAAALAQHEAGLADLAEAGYRAVLRLNPDEPDVLNLLGLILQGRGEVAKAIALFTRALAVEPEFPEALTNLARAHRAAGTPAAAADVARQAIAIDPELTEAHFQLGGALLDLADDAGAAEALRRAAELAPASLEVCVALGRALFRLKDHASAVEVWRAALALKPDDSDLLIDFGDALRATGRPAEAEASYRKALHFRPDLPDAHNGLGAALYALGRSEDAETSYRDALRLRPEFAEAHGNIGNALRDLGRLPEAESSYRTAIRLRPEFAAAHSNLGFTLHALGRLNEAEASHREALRLRPDSPDAHVGLGTTLYARGLPEEAEMNYRDALRLQPDLPNAHYGLGSVLYALGRPLEATARYRQALRLDPELPSAHTDLGFALLVAGQFEEGWKECEWRWKTKSMRGGVRDFSAPLWEGEPIGDGVILLHAEQGLGDTLQFCRYVPLMERGARIILEVQPPLMRLLSRLQGVTAILARGDRLPPVDLHCPLLSLPNTFGTALDSIPADTPYLAADPACAAVWRTRTAGLQGLRVGLVWAGRPRMGSPEFVAIDRRRSIALDVMAPLADVPGVSFVSLQKDKPADQAAAPPRGLALHDFTADLHDFEDTAALVANLDLVISVDTSVVHLAGALGKPVWLLNRFDTCWRWLLNRDDSPWYPHLRQFRQSSPGDWNGVIERVRNALQRLAAGDQDQLRATRAMTRIGM